jgi:hypothetical protein
MARKPQEPPQLTNYFLPAMRLCKIFKSQGVRGAHLGIHPQPLEDPPPIDRSVPEPSEIVIERYGSPSEYQRAARPAFDALWNTAGLETLHHVEIVMEKVRILAGSSPSPTLVPESFPAFRLDLREQAFPR